MAIKSKAALHDQLLHAHVPHELIGLIQRECASASPIVDASLDRLTKWYRAPGFVTNSKLINERAWAVATYPMKRLRERWNLAEKM